MNIYLTDQVQITPITRDANFRTETAGTPFLSDAYIEEDDKIIYGSDGQPIKPARKIVLPYTTNVQEGDRIKVTRKNGIAVIDKDRNIKSISQIGAFGGSHLEVLS
ncbi:MAG: hypothetical protein ACTSPI_00360 [Candidatus Heimdallarchaeaceae archaeon]